MWLIGLKKVGSIIMNLIDPYSRCPEAILWGFCSLCCAGSEVEPTKTTWFIRAADFSCWHLICDWSQVSGSCFFNLIRWRTRSPRPPPVRDVNLCYLTSDPSVASILSAWGAVEMEKTVDVCCFDLPTASICTAFTHPHSDLWSFLNQGWPKLCTPAPGPPLRPHELLAGLFQK